MSRSSKGFADFFPTAPSVLQQKRSKASEDRGRHYSTVNTTSHTSHAPSAARASSGAGEGEGSILTKRRNDGNNKTTTNSILHEESEYANGDVSHEVGSASSTSTTSSVFSASRKEVNIVNHNGVHNATSLTPLTNIDSSPRTNGMTSPPKRTTQDKRATTRLPPKSPFPELVEESVDSRMEEASTPDSIDSERTRPPTGPQARPGRGEVKGYKIVFDPDADKSLKGKEKRNRTAEYKSFGEGVSLHILCLKVCT